MNRLIQYVRDLIRFVREAWPLVRRRDRMSRAEYERAKAELLARYEEDE